MISDVQTGVTDGNDETQSRDQRAALEQRGEGRRDAVGGRALESMSVRSESTTQRTSLRRAHRSDRRPSYLRAARLRRASRGRARPAAKATIGRAAAAAPRGPASASAASTIRAAMKPPPSARAAAAGGEVADDEERERGDRRSDRPAGPGRVVLGGERDPEQQPRRRSRASASSTLPNAAAAARRRRRTRPRRPRARHPDKLRGRNASAQQATDGDEPGRRTVRGAPREPTAADRRGLTPTPRRRRSGSTRPARPAPRPPLEGDAEADLAIVGAGLSGLWAARAGQAARPRARRRRRSTAAGSARAASGRNGGFLSSFLTHGIDNGLARFPDEMATLERLGLENFAATVSRSRAPRDRLRPEHTAATSTSRSSRTRSSGWPRTPRALRALRPRGGAARPRRRSAPRSTRRCSSAASGGTPARRWSTRRSSAGGWRGSRASARRADPRADAGRAGCERAGAGRRARSPTAGDLRASRALLATSAFRGLVGAIRRRVVPVWDYVLVTEPLTPSSGEAIGWANGQGLGDMANRFHYSRPTADGRILWGGYDAIYHYANGVGPERRAARGELRRPRRATSSPPSPSSRASGSATAGAARSTPAAASSPFTAPALGGRVAYTVGHTGLGVGASRFGAGVALDLLDGRDTEATAPARRSRSRRCRSRPSRCAGRRSSSPATASPRPTAAAAGAGCGCERSIGSGSASTAEAQPASA